MTVYWVIKRGDLYMSGWSYADRRHATRFSSKEDAFKNRFLDEKVFRVTRKR